MTANEKVARNKLRLLELAEELGNVSKACGFMGFSRSQFYELKRAFEAHGLEGLMDRPPKAKHFPASKRQETQRRVVEISIEHPSWGKERVRDELVREGLELCSGTVYNIQKRNHLSTRYRRMIALERKVRNEGFVLTAEQLKALESLRTEERHVVSTHPGYLLCQDSFFVGSFKGVGRVWIQAVVDTYSSLAFARLYTERTARTAADMLTRCVLPFYSRERVPVLHMLTDRGSEYLGVRTKHLYEKALVKHAIKHRLTQARTPRTNGFVERFNRTLLDEFLRETLRKKYFASLPELQRDLDAWLYHYNHERPHQGYRNQGRRPYETFSMAKELIVSVPTDPAELDQEEMLV